mmetsp:Transcript_90404/g.235341  ORF Transcript_90404/g.235341 Transcript_90404/m.235341 type:complete len:234 (+) Transcript_90404:680-1381(+)
MSQEPASASLTLFARPSTSRRNLREPGGVAADGAAGVKAFAEELRRAPRHGGPPLATGRPRKVPGGARGGGGVPRNSWPSSPEMSAQRSRISSAPSSDAAEVERVSGWARQQACSESATDTASTSTAEPVTDAVSPLSVEASSSASSGPTRSNQEGPSLPPAGRATRTCAGADEARGRRPSGASSARSMKVFRTMTRVQRSSAPCGSAALQAEVPVASAILGSACRLLSCGDM